MNRRARYRWVGAAGALLVRSLGATIRITDEDRDLLAEARAGGGRVIFALLHGQILLGTHLARRERVVSIISRHRDGEIVYQIARRLGIRAVRGSSTRGGSDAARRLLTDPEFRDLDIVVTPDGPRGPAGRVKPGVIRLARKSGRPIVPVAIETTAPWRLRSWDRFRVPRPFSRGVLRIGPAIEVARDAGPEALEAARASLESALRKLNREARIELRFNGAEGPVADVDVLHASGLRGAVARYLFREGESPATWPLTLLLLPFEGAHRAIRALGGRSRAERRLPVPVISVGNLSVGGTGKTPMVAWLAGRLADRGHRVAILTRGYGGRGEAPAERVVGDDRSIAVHVGDEPLLLARSLPECRVYRGRDRYLAGLLAVARDGCDLCILDDGFQHVGLYRDIDIVLLHAERPFGTGWLLPAGPLREGRAALRRADLIVLCRRWGKDGAASTPPEGLPRGVPRLDAGLVVESIRTLGKDGGAVAPETIRGKRLLAFAGVGDPRSFLAVVEGYAPEAVRFLAFPDHHSYPAASIEWIGREARRWGAEAMITTEKDAVKIGENAFPEWPCHVPSVRFAVEGGQSALEDLLTLVDVRSGGRRSGGGGTVA